MADTLGSQLDEFRIRTSQTLVSLAKPDKREIETLQALGYVASDSSEAVDSHNLSGADPKTKIQISNLLHDAMLNVENAQYEEAIPLLRRALAQQPNLPVANMQYGIAQARLKHPAEAIGPLQKAIQALPDNGLGHYELGLALFETGDWKGAEPQFEAAVAKAPRWADAQFSLASVYARTDRVPEAMEHLDICLSLDPNHYRANLLRGRILSLQHKPSEALLNLKKAAAIQPDSREAHSFLADAYEQLGDAVNAAAERARAGQR